MPVTLDLSFRHLSYDFFLLDLADFIWTIIY